MRLLAVGLAIWCVAACTKPNPRSCRDGNCTDPAYPFCDVDGRFQGEQNTCIAVSCMAGEFAECRDDRLGIFCNGTGNNYDLVECQLGCSERGCSQCAANTDCDNPTPTCDLQTSTCRGCASDVDCDSQICNTSAGTCLGVDEVVYASPQGSTTSACTPTEPCALARALVVASSIELRRTVLLTPGRYGAKMNLTGTIDLIGPEAIVEGDISGDVVVVAADSNVQIRGLTIQLPRGHFQCAPETGTAHVTLVDVNVTGDNELAIENCDMRWTRVRREMPTGGAGVVVRENGILIVNDSYFKNATVGGSGPNAKITVVNSIFDDAYFTLIPQDQTPSQSIFRFAFNTAYSPTAESVIDCSNFFGGNTTTIVENNVFAGANDSVSTGPGCTVLNNVLFPQTSQTSSNTNRLMDPRFVNKDAGDFRLMADSPAIDLAQPSAGLDPAVDYDGQPRPQGAGFDSGAFERAAP